MHLKRFSPLLLLSGDHCFLDTTDECYYMGSYTCCHRPTYKPLVLSVKRGYKPAIRHASKELLYNLPQSWLCRYTVVPMPSSLRSDNHMMQVASELGAADTRELLLQRSDTLSSHGGWRPSPDVRSSLLYVNELVARPRPCTVLILDDVITTGSHFRAAKRVLRARWPDIRVVGLFLSRACPRDAQRCWSGKFCDGTPIAQLAEC